MNWKEIKNKPSEEFGWFAVAVLPTNHSGSNNDLKTDLNGDNDWRESFGFRKAWLNSGRWYEPSNTRMRCDDITELVTHWDYLPKVPVLTESFHSKYNSWLNPKINKDGTRSIAEKNFNERGLSCDYKSFEEGFLAAFEFIGIY